MRAAVVVNTFDRPVALSRLLSSLDRSRIATGTELVISIDGGGRRAEETVAIARGFEWPHGPMKVIERDDLGLVGHFRACGDLVEDLGPIVMLEDDLVVGPDFLRFAAAALDHTAGDERVAGVSLSKPRFDGFRHAPFHPMIDGSDGVYAKVPWFHGMAWTPQQWRSHRGGADAPQVELPRAFAALDAEEWFPDAVRSLVSTDRWYLLSRDAHAVNFGDAGVHFETATATFQQPLALRSRSKPEFLGLDDAGVIPYDEHMEPDARWLAAHVGAIDDLDVTIDLRGTRGPDDFDTTWVVTSRPSRDAVQEWGATMHPLEQNLLSDVAGTSLRLCRAADVIEGSRADAVARRVVELHALHGQKVGVRATVAAGAREIQARLGSALERRRPS